jgi:putative transposase
LKYEDVYVKAYGDGRELHDGLDRYFEFFNQKRLHQALDYRTPSELYLRSPKDIE